MGVRLLQNIFKILKIKKKSENVCFKNSVFFFFEIIHFFFLKLKIISKKFQISKKKSELFQKKKNTIFETHVLTFFLIFKILKMFCNNRTPILMTHVHTLNKKKKFFSQADYQKNKGGSGDLVPKKGKHFW